MSKLERVRLPMRQVDRIIPIREGCDMPSNFATASGSDRNERVNDALRILGCQPDKNIILIPGETRRDIEGTVASFCKVSPAHRFRPQFEYEEETSVIKSLARYFNRRSGRQHIVSECISGLPMADARQIEEYCTLSINDARPLPSVGKIVSSMMTFIPNYKGSWGEDNFINTHIDAHDEFDVRIVECSFGSATLAFDDRDFTYRHMAFGTKQNMQAIPASDTICGWVIPEGSSIAIRTPSPRTMEMGAKPSVHAHGMGRTDGPEARLTFRHDYRLI